MVGSKKSLFSYFILGFLFFLGFLYFLFPYDVLKNQVIAKIQTQVSPQGRIQIEAEKLSPYWFPGATLHDVRVLKNGDVIFRADKFSARLRIIPLFTKTQSAGFSILTYDGKLSGHIGQKDSTLIGKVNSRDISLKKLGSNLPTAIPIDGRMSGNIKFSLNSQNPQEGKLDGKIEFEKAKIVPGNIAGFEINTNIRLDDNDKPAILQFTMDDGVIRPSTKFQNPDTNIDLDGKITYGRSISSSFLDLNLTFGLSDAIKQTLPSVIFGDFMLGRAQGTDGTFSYQIRGPFSRPRWIPVRK